MFYVAMIKLRTATERVIDGGWWIIVHASKTKYSKKASEAGGIVCRARTPSSRGRKNKF
jgi:hypothetical protein